MAGSAAASRVAAIESGFRQRREAEQVAIEQAAEAERR